MSMVISGTIVSDISPLCGQEKNKFKFLVSLANSLEGWAKRICGFDVCHDFWDYFTADACRFAGAPT